MAAFERLRGTWLQEEVLKMGPGNLLLGGPQAGLLVPGGFHALRLDLPGTVSLYASQQGGFRVQCPSCAAPLAREFSRAMEDFRQGGSDSLTCSACRKLLHLEEASCSPAIGLASGALILMDVGSAEASPRLVESVVAMLGPSPRVVLRRSS